MIGIKEYQTFRAIISDYIDADRIRSHAAVIHGRLARLRRIGRRIQNRKAQIGSSQHTAVRQVA